MSKTRTETWLTLIAMAIGLPIAAVALFVTYVSNVKPLHSTPQDVPSVMPSTPSPTWADAVEKGRELVRARLIEQDVPGMSVAVGVGGEVVWAEGFGWANLESRVPVTPTMRFRIGHVSKSLTSAGVGLLLEKGTLRLNEEIQTRVPAFPRKEWPVTLRQLMGHVAGVRHYRSENDYALTAHCDRASEGVQSFATDPLLFEPGTRYSYSTYGWVLVSAAVEAAAGEPFFTFMRTKVFAPLGMTGTTIDSAAEPIPDRATFYERDVLGRVLPTTLDYSCLAGAGAFLSTPSDLVRFGVAISNGKLLRADTVKMLQTRQLLSSSGAETEYGLGWTLDTVTLAGASTRLASHSNRTLTGGSTSFLIFPDRGIVVAVTTNISFADTRSIALALAEAFVPPR